VIQNSAWKSACSAIRLATGNASAPPTPSIALITATAAPTRSRGRVALSRLMPRGIVAIDAPWTARPTISTAMSLVKQVISEPTTSIVRATSIIRRLPYMSPSRPNSGTATAPTSSVEVSSHSTLLAEVSSVVGNVASTGISSAWVSETASAANPTTSSSTLARPVEVWAATSASVAPSIGWPRWCGSWGGECGEGGECGWEWSSVVASVSGAVIGLSGPGGRR